MTDRTRPLMFGYLRVHALAANVTREAIEAQFRAFAEAEGYEFVWVFVDQDRYAPSALDALIDAVKKYDATAVAVPSMDHLKVLGAPPPLAKLVQYATGAQVLAMDSAPATTIDATQ
jgi:hypothetical protein